MTHFQSSAYSDMENAEKSAELLETEKNEQKMLRLPSHKNYLTVLNSLKYLIVHLFPSCDQNCEFLLIAYHATML